MTEKAPPKRRNAVQTKAKILAAAKKSFSEIGFHRSGIRDIASIADVSSTMLLLNFGSKAGLFEAALTDTMHTEQLLRLKKEDFGEQLAKIFLNKEHSIATPSMIVLSTSDPDAREIAARVTKEHALAPLAKWLGPPDANVRALQIFLLSTGFLFYTRNLPLLRDTKGAERKLGRWFARVVQDIVDQS